MIVCCGEALIDMLPRQTAAGETAFVPYAGGALFNSAIALGRLGVTTGFFTGLSSDMFGDMLRDALDASKVDHSKCATSDRPTTLAFVKLVDGHASYAFFDENSAGRMIGQSDLPQFDESVAALHFGAVSLIPEPCGSSYESLMRRECQNRIISLDPNIRASFIADAPAHRARIERMIAMSDIVKLSDEDLAWLTPGQGSSVFAAHCIARGVSIVVVTKGKDGAVGYCRDGEVAVVPETVDVVDTVGAGDTFNAGLLASLKRDGLLDKAALAAIDRHSLERALALGARAAAVTVSRAGANPPFAEEIGF